MIRFMAAALALSMLVGAAPVTAFAEEKKPADPLMDIASAVETIVTMPIKVLDDLAK